MKFDPTKPVKTRNGRKEEIIYNDGEIIQAMIGGFNSKDIQYFGMDGNYYNKSTLMTTSPLDLINVTEGDE